MAQLRILGLTFVAAVTMAVLAVATASAAEAEAGLLYLEKESGAITFSGSVGSGEFSAAGGSITCAGASITGTSTQTEKHVTSGTTTVQLSSCKLTKGEAKIACNTEGDAKEVILFPGSFNLYNALDTATKTVLEPGTTITISGVLRFKCGAVATVEVKGTALGLIREASLTADVTKFDFHFLIHITITCDKENVVCKKAQEKANELLANFTGSFEKAEFGFLVSVSLNKMTLVDD